MQGAQGLGSWFKLDHGLTGVSTGGNEAAFGMPANPTMVPAQQLTGTQLEQLLQSPTLDSSLDALIRPEVNDRLVLTPAVFRDTLARTPEMLEQAAGRQAPGSDEAKILMRASRQMSELTNNVTLASMYQGALVPG